MVTDVSVGFRPPCWSSSRWAPAWRLHTNLYKFGQNISSDISYTKYSSDLNLGEGLCIRTSFHLPDSGLYLLNGFDFYIDLFWIAWHIKPVIFTSVSVDSSSRSYFGNVRVPFHAAPKCGTQLIQYVTLHFWDQWGAAQLRSVREIAPKSPLFCVNRNTIRYGFRAGARVSITVWT